MDNTVLSPDSRKLHRQDVGDRKDLIGKLPDDILHYILSFLSTKDAVRTSILARRWEFLWTCLSDFNLEKEPSSTRKKESQNQTQNCLFNLVDRILHKDNYIKKFRFASYGITVDADRANSWISAVLKHKVEELDLSLDIRSSFALANNFSAPESLNKLNLELDCVLNIPSCICFPGLKTLTLAMVTFSDETSAQQFFSGCPVLQKLTLYNCVWKNVKNINMKIPTIRTLIIYYCPLSPDYILNCKVTIDAVSFVSFSCTSYLTVESVLINLASLVDAYIEVTHCRLYMKQYVVRRAIKLLSGISHVKSLTLSNDTLEFLSYAENPPSLLPTFHDLTHFTVRWGTPDFTSETLMDILEKSPNLVFLNIAEGLDPEICLNGEDGIFSSVPHCFKSCLKSFIISDFDGSAADMQLLSFLLKNATTLGKVTIFCKESLSADLKKQGEIRNQLQIKRKGLASCEVDIVKLSN